MWCVTQCPANVIITLYILLLYNNAAPLSSSLTLVDRDGVAVATAASAVFVTGRRRSAASALIAAAEYTKKLKKKKRKLDNVCRRRRLWVVVYSAICVCTSHADDPSTNRNARSGITPPSILRSRHFLPSHRTAVAYASPLPRRRSGIGDDDTGETVFIPFARARVSFYFSSSAAAAVVHRIIRALRRLSAVYLSLCGERVALVTNRIRIRRIFEKSFLHAISRYLFI